MTFLETGRVGYFEALGFCHPAGTPGTVRFPFILAEVSCRFLSPLQLGETPVVHVRCTHMGTKSFRFAYRITDRDTGREIATAASAQVCYDYAAGRSVPLPEELRMRITAFEGGPARS